MDDRWVRLLVNAENRYPVTIEVRGPLGTWEDIRLVAERDLAVYTAFLCDRLRVTEQEARTIAWGQTNVLSQSEGVFRRRTARMAL